MKNDPEVAQAVIEARANAAKDDIDHNELLRAKARVSTETLLDKCDVTTTIFIMKTLGGLVESQKDATVNVNIMKYTNE
jgi:hypothetical protein